MKTYEATKKENIDNYFRKPEDAIRYSVINARAQKAKSEIHLVKDAQIVGGLCDLSNIYLELSNSLEIHFNVRHEIVDWELNSINENLLNSDLEFDPILIRTKYGEYVYDPTKILSDCIGRSIINISADLSHVQLLLNGLPIVFFAYTIIDTGEPLLVWCDIREPDEIQMEQKPNIS